MYKESNVRAGERAASSCPTYFLSNVVGVYTWVQAYKKRAVDEPYVRLYARDTKADCRQQRNISPVCIRVLVRLSTVVGAYLTVIV